MQNDIKDILQHTKPYHYKKIIINIIMFLFDQTKALIMTKSINFEPRGIFFRSLFLYCAKYKLGGTLRYGVENKRL